MMTPSFADHFSGHAADYARFRPAYPETLARYLSDLAPSRTRAWECGCGNGQLSGQLAAYFTEIMATDASTAQMDAYHTFQRVLSTAWGPGTCRRRIQWPLSLRLGRVMATNP